MTVHHTNDDMVKLLQQEFEQTSSVPRYVTHRVIHSTTILKRFGSWNNALVSAGIPVVIKPTPEPKVCEWCKKEYKGERRHFCNWDCMVQFRRSTIKPTRTREEWKREQKERTIVYWATIPFNDMGWDRKRTRVIEEQSGACNRCKLSSWLNEPLTLEVDHIDGDNKNDARENLEALCPNCHSLTPTWKGRNKTKRGQISDDDLKVALSNSPSIRQALMFVGLSPKGQNYKRAKRLHLELEVSNNAPVV